MSADAYAVVWRPGSGAQRWRSGMSYDQCEAQDKPYFDQNLRDQGLRIVTLELQGGKYTAVWRPGSGAQSWKPGMSYAEFKSQDKIYFDQGLRLRVLEIENGKYTAVWRPGTGAQWWTSQLAFDDFKTEEPRTSGRASGSGLWSYRPIRSRSTSFHSLTIPTGSCSTATSTTRSAAIAIRVWTTGTTRSTRSTTPTTTTTTASARADRT